VTWVLAIGLGACLMLLVRTSPWAWHCIDALFRHVSYVVNHFGFDVDFRIGPTFFGCEWLLVYWSFLVVRCLRTGNLLWSLLIGVLLPLVAVPSLHLLGGMWREATSSTFLSYDTMFEAAGSRRLLLSPADYVSPRNLRLALVLLVVGVEVLGVGRRAGRLEYTPPARPGKGPYFACLLVVAGCLALSVPALVRGRSAANLTEAPVVKIFDPVGSLTAAPNDENFGFLLSGMFSKLPVYLSLLGYSVDRWDPAQGDLDGTDVLVLINLPEAFSGQEKERILDFVRVGGSLLCLGDHVAGDQIAGPFNDLLEPTGIRFNRDSACSFCGWLPGLLQQHPAIYADSDPWGDSVDAAAIGTGASLALTGGACPVFIGREGFSDASNPENKAGGELGDLVYRYGEDIGDLVLAAEDRLGEGSVVVFGDTSSFQNGTLAFSYNMVARTFRYLADCEPEGGRWSPPHPHRASPGTPGRT